MNEDSVPSYRKKYNPGDPGPHYNPYIIDISDEPVSKKGNIVFFAIILLQLVITEVLLRNDPEFKNTCSLFSRLFN